MSQRVFKCSRDGCDNYLIGIANLCMDRTAKDHGRIKVSGSDICPECAKSRGGLTYSELRQLAKHLPTTSCGQYRMLGKAARNFKREVLRERDSLIDAITRALKRKP